MFQNLKVDIIYYKTGTDFEMEFNLCGCCRMRLLTDKPSDKKGFVHSLARAVSRSKVILIVGKLFGDDGIIQTVSGAIGKTPAEIDCKKYGIVGSDRIAVINGATPLVTPEGYFGGCIIESGPQTMILLSDNKNVRKTIMTTLIHPYIEDLCAVELKSNAAASDPIAPTVDVPAPAQVDAVPTDLTPDNETEPAPETEEQPEPAITSASTEPDGTDEPTIPVDSAEDGTPEEAETDSAETESAMPEESDISSDSTDDAFFLLDTESEEKSDPKEERPLSDFATDDVYVSGGMIFETDDSCTEADDRNGENAIPDLFIEPARMKRNRADFYNDAYSYETDNGFFYHENGNRDGKPKRSFSSNLPILITAIILLVILAVLCYCIFYIPARDGVSVSAYLKDTFDVLFGKI